MKYTTYKNFSSTLSILDSTIHEKCERKFDKTSITYTLCEKYLNKVKSYKNSTSLDSVVDGDPVIFVVDGDYTVPAGTTLTPTNRCKGLYMFINGTLTINGTISMTARGANAEGKFVHVNKRQILFFKDSLRSITFPDNSVYLNAATPTPPVIKNNSHGQANVINGQTIRCSGSGGYGSSRYSGQAVGLQYCIPGNGTSFSGGSGSGGVGIPTETGQRPNILNAGAPNGGAGGAGQHSNTGIPRYASGGAGNPGGTSSSYAGANGTGGLLIIIAKSIINNGIIESNGSTCPYNSYTYSTNVNIVDA